MKSAWKAFAAEAAALFLLGMACTYVAGTWLEAKHIRPEAVNVTRPAMIVGIAAASALLSLLGAWRFWRLKPLLWAVAVMSGLFAGNPGAALLGLLISVTVYWVVSKVRMLVGFYQPSQSTEDQG